MMEAYWWVIAYWFKVDPLLKKQLVICSIMRYVKYNFS